MKTLFIIFALVFCFSCKENPTTPIDNFTCTKYALYYASGGIVLNPSDCPDYNFREGIIYNSKYVWGMCGNQYKADSKCYKRHRFE
jgi:hypothetical protein